MNEHVSEPFRGILNAFSAFVWPVPASRPAPVYCHFCGERIHHPQADLMYACPDCKKEKGD